MIEIINYSCIIKIVFSLHGKIKIQITMFLKKTPNKKKKTPKNQQTNTQKPPLGTKWNRLASKFPYSVECLLSE